MAVQDQSSQGGPPIANGVSLSSGLYSPKLNDQFSCGNDYALKVRKPYTITKQRERWTDEEHNRFLEALKLHGRAWRRIEEHVGTKTAVQIRSHAQKFFSKVLRDSNGNIANSEEAIEIPPPRPKRKPMHPYPRKLAGIAKKEFSILEQPMGSNSMKCDFDQEHQSPKSVLSKVALDNLGSSDSDTVNGNTSPMSSISGVHTSSLTLAEPKTPYEEVGMNTDSCHDEKPDLMKLQLFPKESVSTKEDITEQSSGRTLKLFGMTLVLKDTCRSSSPTTEECKPIPLAIHVHCISKKDGKLELPGHRTPTETSAISKLRLRVRPETCGKGFVPYKRCIANAERKTLSSNVTVKVDKREEQHIHLSL